jgi:hypothetical protein
LSKKAEPVIIDKRVFDAAFRQMLKSAPLPLSEIPKKRKPAKRKARKPTR